MGDKFFPTPTPEANIFWDKAALGELWLPLCVETARAFFPPRSFSPFTGGPVSWTKASGRATLASYVIVHRPDPGFEAPYVVAVAELAEGPRLLTNLPGAPPYPDRLVLGAPLELTFEVRNDQAIPQFRMVALE